MTALILVITRSTLLHGDARASLSVGAALVWLANVYMCVFGRLRLDIHEERLTIAAATTRAGGDGSDAPDDAGTRRGSAS